MRLESSKANGEYLASLSDKLTFADNSAFRKLLEDVKAAKVAKCTFDFRGLQIIDSSGLGMMMIAVDDAKKGGWQLSVRNAAGPVRDLLRLSRLDQLVAVE